MLTKRPGSESIVLDWLRMSDLPRMTVHRVDPRQQCWEDDNPVFRVDIRLPGSGEAKEMASNEFEIQGDGLSVTEVICWARSQTPPLGRYSVFVVATPPPAEGQGLIRLLEGHVP